MIKREINWPQKTREMHNHHIDSTIWNEFTFRDDDIVIATYAKSGTTWVQQIVSQLLFNGQEDLEVADMSPWMDLRVPPKEVKLAEVETQQHRRFLKTHLPVDALVFSPKARYLYIGRDVVWSLYHHHTCANEQYFKVLNESPGLVGPAFEKSTVSIETYYRKWLEMDGYPFWPFWENVRSWWAIRELPNVFMMHFEKMKKNLPEEIRKVAEFLNISIDDRTLNVIADHCSFDYMKAHASNCVPGGGIFWEGGAETFMNKGTNGRWCNILTIADIERYESMAVEQLSEDCAHWLATGERQ